MAPKIAHLTVLNPLHHARIFEKLARSQRRLGYQVCVLGQGRGAVEEVSGVRLLPQGEFGRLHWRRWLAPWRMLLAAWREQAEVYVIHAPELLLTAWWLKRLRGAVILYDVHEDYAQNLRHGAHWPNWLRRPLAWLLRAWERRAVRGWVDGVSYAERIYVNQLQASHYLLLENRYVSVGTPAHPPTVRAPYLLYTGTLARAWGLFEALELWRAWNAIEPMQLVVAGHTQQGAVWQELEKAVQATGLSHRFSLIGGQAYVSHPHIMGLMERCLAVLGLYQPLPQIEGKIPTKFFEAMAVQRPVIFTPQPSWLALNRNTPFGLAWQPGSSVEALVAKVKSWEAPALPPGAYAWEIQEAALAAWLKQLIP